jgi:hypothetical protein
VAQRQDPALKGGIAALAIALAQLLDLGEDLIGTALGNGR